MATLYIDEQGAVLRKEGERLVVTKDGVEILSLPAIKVEQIVIFGNVQITAQALALLLRSSIEVALLTHTGKLLGQLTPPECKNVPLRMKQYEKYHDETFRQTFASLVIQQKIKNSVTNLKKYLYNHKELDLSMEIREMENAVRNAAAAPPVSSLMGIEGYASAAYFRAFGKCFLSEFQFTTRTRRPPRDPVNALLSLGYTLIANELMWLLDALGFDPHIGFLHGIEYGRPSLSLDIMEEFRAPIVDHMVLFMCNNKMFKPQDFEPEEEGGIYLKEDARKKFFEQYEKTMTAPFSYGGTQITFRKAFQNQAQQLSKLLIEGKPYEPFGWE